jgi:hypothetical protein
VPEQRAKVFIEGYDLRVHVTNPSGEAAQCQLGRLDRIVQPIGVGTQLLALLSLPGSAQPQAGDRCSS